MRINLDYYRILSVPIKANSPQLERAYGDRVKQQSRRDYSKSAIAIRKKLLTRAFNVLSNPEKRADYDNKFLEPSNAQLNIYETNNTQANSNQINNTQVPTSQVEDFSAISQQANSSSPLTTKIAPELPPLSAEPYLEIENPLIIGALIILHELAEYEMVISIGNEYLRQEANPNSFTAKQLNKNGSISTDSISTRREALDSTTEAKKDHLSAASPYTNSRTAFKQQETREDTIFCVALSCLEISREKWRRQEWEEAAAHGEEGLKILQQESSSFFPHLQTEIQSELNLLKPYRILNLLEHNTIGSKLRSRGLKLLQEVLAQREGIENTSIDPSGLKSDQFLYFIQQIRNYLTLQEQKELFLVESKRGSHPGSCIAAYALIAEGFAKKKPSSVMQANEILINLGQHQNTHWERAVCALLLGQAEESQEVIEQIRQDSTYALIKKRSHDSPDLLPGLCFYGEQWLNKEVLSQFQDLKSGKVTLSEYFNDSNVQAYLETVAPITYNSQLKSSLEQKSKAQTVALESPSLTNENRSRQKVSANKQGIKSLFPWLRNNAKQSRKFESQSLQPQEITRQQNETSQNGSSHSPATSQKLRQDPKLTEQTTVYSASQENTAQQKNVSGYYKPASTSNSSYQNVNLPNSKNVSYDDSMPGSFTQNGQGNKTAVKARQADSNGNGNGANKYYSHKPQNVKRKGKAKSASPNPFLKSFLLLLALVGGLGTLSFLFTRVQLSNNSANNRNIKEATNKSKTKSPEPPQLTLNKQKSGSPATGVPETKKATPTTQAPEKAGELAKATNALDKSTAKQVVQKWLDGKKTALGKNYESDQLNQILTSGMLTQWKERSNYYKQNKIYRQLNHTLNVRSVKFDPAKPTVATVEAEVTEVAQHYQGEKLNQSQSYNDNLLVRYNLIKQDGSWRIKSSELVESL